MAKLTENDRHRLLEIFTEMGIDPITVSRSHYSEYGWHQFTGKIDKELECREVRFVIWKAEQLSKINANKHLFDKWQMEVENG